MRIPPGVADGGRVRRLTENPPIQVVPRWSADGRWIYFRSNTDAQIWKVPADGGEAGLEAFHAARKLGEPFDVVITDLGMPLVDGRQVAQGVKTDSPRTPVIMLTGWGTMLKEEGNIPAQVDAVVTKPPKLADLVEALAKVTERPKLRRRPEKCSEMRHNWL